LPFNPSLDFHEIPQSWLLIITFVFRLPPNLLWISKYFSFLTQVDHSFL
jgi:hypothetical protein